MSLLQIALDYVFPVTFRPLLLQNASCTSLLSEM